ncbi:MAG: universal stress protein A-like protein [Ramlibacter sp.]|nr:universal stress protein A-like protein [Ramlibacter sp.]
MATVLLTTDGSDLASAAMTKGVELLGRAHRFVAVSVVPPAFVPAAAIGPMESHGLVIGPALEDAIEAEDRVESTFDIARLTEILEVEADVLVETGEPGAVICEVAARIGADVVVVGSHGHGWLQRVLIGSVSNHVLHHAPCPVLVMRLEDTQAD